VSGLLLLNLTVEVPLAGLPSAATKPPWGADQVPVDGSRHADHVQRPECPQAAAAEKGTSIGYKKLTLWPIIPVLLRWGWFFLSTLRPTPPTTNNLKQKLNTFNKLNTETAERGEAKFRAGEGPWGEGLFRFPFLVTFCGKTKSDKRKLLSSFSSVVKIPLTVLAKNHPHNCPSY
jgi:hypothetical protein